MHVSHQRRRFLGMIAAAAPGVVLSQRAAAHADAPAEQARKDEAGFPAQPTDQVRQIVGWSHFNLDGVKSLAEARPELAKAAWDWGFGDWETALGAASHTGRREIAEVLMANGARPTIFTLAMLGKVDAVRALVRAMPGIERSLGPHGISLMQHARAGGDEAQPVVDYLATVEGSDIGQFDLGLAPEAHERYHGRYRIEGDLALLLLVQDDRRGRLALEPEGGASRQLHRVDEHVFAPAGAPSVRIVCIVPDGRCRALRIEIGGAVWTAVRMQDEPASGPSLQN